MEKRNKKTKFDFEEKMEVIALTADRINFEVLVRSTIRINDGILFEAFFFMVSVIYKNGIDISIL